MPYTLLLVTERGVVLRDYHLRRLKLDADDATRDAFLRLVAEPPPGVRAVWSDRAGGFRAEPRPGSKLRDGMTARFLPSPVAERAGQLPKPAPGGPYDGVRLQGIATLLTSTDGSEIFEACRAAVVSWDGERIVCAPPDRPRVWSTAEAAIRDHLPVREAMIPPTSDAILLVNAVKGTCALSEAHSRGFPAAVRREIEDLFASLTQR
jgi:hypothetical protein